MKTDENNPQDWLKSARSRLASADRLFAEEGASEAAVPRHMTRVPLRTTRVPGRKTHAPNGDTKVHASGNRSQLPRNRCCPAGQQQFQNHDSCSNNP